MWEWHLHLKEFDSIVPIKKTYYADISYIGTHFCGFQCQPEKSSIQDEVERVLAVFFAEKTKVIGASRTDSGVHAEKQRLMFKTYKEFDQHKWLRGINSMLHRDVKFQTISPCLDDFHPIRLAKAKVYRYRLWTGFCDNPFCAPYVWQVNRSLDIEKIQDQIRLFIGKHNFTSFCSSDSSAKTKVREILDVHVDVKGPMIEVWILGTGFLKQMIRIMIGTVVQQAIGKLDLSITELIELQDRKKSGKTAPAQGLSLVDIFYDNIPTMEEIISKKGMTFPV